MSASTGPIVAAGMITVGNAWLVQDKPLSTQSRVVVGTLIAAAGLNLWEHAMPRTAAAVAWLALVAVLMVRVDPLVPSPLESFAEWFGK